MFQQILYWMAVKPYSFWGICIWSLVCAVFIHFWVEAIRNRIEVQVWRRLTTDKGTFWVKATLAEVHLIQSGWKFACWLPRMYRSDEVWIFPPISTKPLTWLNKKYWWQFIERPPRGHADGMRFFYPPKLRGDSPSDSSLPQVEVCIRGEPKKEYHVAHHFKRDPWLLAAEIVMVLVLMAMLMIALTPRATSAQPATMQDTTPSVIKSPVNPGMAPLPEKHHTTDSVVYDFLFNSPGYEPARRSGTVVAIPWISIVLMGIGFILICVGVFVQLKRGRKVIPRD